MEQTRFQTNVVTGPALLAMAEGVRGWQKRDCYGQLDAYLYSKEYDRVCLLFGLRRTGKTTLLRQAVLEMTPVNAARTAYINATVLETMGEVNGVMIWATSTSFWTRSRCCGILSIPPRCFPTSMRPRE